MASLSARFSSTISPTLARLSGQPRQLSDIRLRLPQGRLNLARQPKLPMGQSVNVYNIPVRLESAKIAPHRNIVIGQIAAAPISSQRLSLRAEGMKEVSPMDIAQMITEDMAFIQTQGATPRSGINQYEKPSQGISLRSLLAIEAQ